MASQKNRLAMSDLPPTKTNAAVAGVGSFVALVALVIFASRSPAEEIACCRTALIHGLTIADVEFIGNHNLHGSEAHEKYAFADTLESSRSQVRFVTDLKPIPAYRVKSGVHTITAAPHIKGCIVEFKIVVQLDLPYKKGRAARNALIRRVATERTRKRFDEVVEQQLKILADGKSWVKIPGATQKETAK